MSDTIFITGVVIHARHGVMEHETEVGQRFVIDLELSADLSESSRTDRLADTVSYSDVVATATAAFKNANYKLLERAAGAVAEADPDGSFPASAPSRSPCTSRMPRSPRFSTMSAWC